MRLRGIRRPLRARVWTMASHGHTGGERPPTIPFIWEGWPTGAYKTGARSAGSTATAASPCPARRLGGAAARRRGGRLPHLAEGGARPPGGGAAQLAPALGKAVNAKRPGRRSPLFSMVTACNFGRTCLPRVPLRSGPDPHFPLFRHRRSGKDRRPSSVSSRCPACSWTPGPVATSRITYCPAWSAPWEQPGSGVIWRWRGYRSCKWQPYVDGPCGSCRGRRCRRGTRGRCG